MVPGSLQKHFQNRTGHNNMSYYHRMWSDRAEGSLEKNFITKENNYLGWILH